MLISDMLTSKDLYHTLPIFKLLVLTFLTLVHIQYVCCGMTDQIDNQFNKYAFIEPKLFNARHKREIQSTKINPNGLEHAHGITLTFVNNQQEYIIDLSLNRGLIPINYFEKHQKNGSHVINRPKANELEFCNYNGKIRDFPNSWAAISTCDGIRGMFFDGISYHYIENVEREPGDKYHILYKHEDLKTNYTCGFPSAPELIPNEIKRNRRNTRSLKGPYKQSDKSRFIELVLVVDQEEYKSFNSNLSKVFQHTKDITNIINSLYVPLNIFVTLVGVVVWADYNEITIASNGDTTLTNFLNYRRENLVKNHPNDNAQLLTKIQFENGVVGKALKGPICTYEFSGGVNSDHSVVHGLVATTIAHEIGHNLGMEHDEPECDCPNERCVMAPSSGQKSPTHWSSCSLEYLALAFEHGMDYCLRNKPVRLFESPECGNSFVEEGEQCDCGLKHMCTNPCCNPDTCMFYENATCATGECCDLNTCSKKMAGVECRSAPHECDLPEYCTGDSEYCPDNVFKFDGSACESTEAFCFNGSCRSKEYQCRLLWGPTGESSNEQCYIMMNIKGSPQGNCGYNRLNQTYVKCNQENVQCGMLQCKHKNERLEFGMETLSIVSHTFINYKGSIIPCRTAIVDLGLSDVDPGLTPDGAKCGENKMCVNQKCMAVKDFIAQSKNCKDNCNGNGVCNNQGHCHCNIGYAPPYCDYPGPGGSDDSGPASSPNTFKGFMTGMYVLTFGAIPLLLAILLFAYCSKNHSPSDWNKTNRKKLSNDSEIGNKPNGTVSPSSTLLIDNQKPLSLRAELVGNYKGFSIKPLVPNEQPVVSRTPSRPAPSAPAAVAVSNEKAGRLQISQPVLDATTSSTVHKLVSIPSKPAPPIPTTARPASMAADNKNSSAGAGGYPTLRRITSFMKNQKTDDKKHTIPRANSKFDKEELKKLEISHPILQKEINVPSEPLPLEADQHKAVVLRAQSLRVANNTNQRPRVPNFGSMKYKRPTSVAAPTTATSAAAAVTSCSRPTSPPPPRPPASQPVQVHADYQIPRPQATDCRNDVLQAANVSCDEPHLENIYSVIDERPTVDDDDSCVYKVPKSLESSLLGEIVSAIQERNHESIYTSKPAVDLPAPQQQQQTYENYMSSPASSTTSSGYMRPVDVKSRAASYNQPDLVKNCDENRSLNPSPDVLEAKKLPTADKPTVLFPKPVVGVASKSALTATVGLKKKLSDSSRYPSKGVADIQKRFESHGSVLKKNPPVSTKPTISGNR